MRVVKRIAEWIARYRYPLIPAVAAVVLALPSLFVGIQADDWALRSAALGIDPVPGVSINPWQPFMFEGDADTYRALMDHGWLPWWTDLQCRTVHMRFIPLMTHFLDFRLWDATPIIMHIHSLLWFAAVVYLACVLYRRLLGPAHPVWVVGLAALLFAIDEAHAIPASWLANRNSLVAAVFGIATLIFYDRYRRDGWSAGALLAPAALLLSLLSKEEGICTVAYLFAYAMFIDRAAWRNRLAALAPCVIVVAAWLVAYKTLGYGAQHTDVYFDPSENPIAFVHQIIQKGPVYLLGQFGLPPSDATTAWSAAAYRIHWLWAVIYVSVLAVFLFPLIRRDATARFWACGMLLSVIPSCAIFPSDRLLMFAGVGGHALVAMWLAGVFSSAGWLPKSTAWRRGARWTTRVLIAIHLVVAPLGLLAGSYSMRLVGAMLDRNYETMPTDAAFANQTVVFVNSRSQMIDRCLFLSREAVGIPVPNYALTLAPAASGSVVTRVDDRTLVVRPDGGYLKPLRWTPPEDRPAPWVSTRYIGQLLDTLTRSARHPMRIGERVELSTATVTITALTADGRPAEATFVFAKSLDAASYRWLMSTSDGYQPFFPPRVGETKSVPSVFD